MSTSNELESLKQFPKPPKETAISGAEPTMVLGNFVKLEEIGSKYIYVYLIEITNSDSLAETQQVQEPDLRQQIFASAQKAKPLSKLVFDGREYAYAAKPLHKKLNWTDGESRFTASLKIDETDCQFNVTIKAHRTYDVKMLKKYCWSASDIPQAYVQGAVFALDSIIRSCSFPSMQVVSGRKLFPKYKVTTNAGFDAWWEYRMSVRMARREIYLTISARAVPVITAQTVSEMAQVFFKKRQWTDKPQQQGKRDVRWAKFEPCVRGLQVMVDGNQMMLNGLTARTASELQIDGKSLAEYYQQFAGIEQMDATWPCAITGRDNRPVPLCLCKLEPQVLSGISGWQRDKLMDLSVLNPEMRQQLLNVAAQELSDACNSDPNLLAFGIRTEPTLASIPAQVLPRPQMRMGLKDNSEQAAVGDNGEWKMKHVQQSCSGLKSWAVVVFASKQQCSESQTRAFVLQLIKTMTQLQIPVEATQPRIYHASLQKPIAKTLQTITQSFKDGHVQLLICVLPSHNQAIYGEIKRVAWVQLGVQTQCVLMQRVQGGHRPKLLEHLALKINTKLGGFTADPLLPDQPQPPTIIVSADVCHTTEARVSVASIVWSIDLQAQRFAGSIVQHPEHQEIIENMDAIIRHALRSFYQHTGKKPVRILYFRDGVSDSQLEYVKQVELGAIIRGCALIEPLFRPQITVIIARKRHFARFMLPKANCPLGTVVMQMAHPQILSFYLIAHHAQRGVAKPVYFMVLHDEVFSTSLDQLYQLTYRLCFAYPIVTRVVTMPASLYYAHRLSGKGRMQINSPFDELSRSQASSANAKPASTTPNIHLVPVHERLADTMYFL
ncbi:hypothetical protein LPJ78_003682 [Coemansia sp. RSA 989]|nr:hypothetical protein LPJ78_003682 [Coemansia sp. RSA 989]KAJ1871711.1 hypothetical protein LPJ55_003659 [Coemansia sp. RSA 990]